MKWIDLTGSIINGIKILDGNLLNDRQKVLGKCHCGKEKIFNKPDILSKQIKSCGNCPSKFDLNKLEIINLYNGGYSLRDLSKIFKYSRKLLKSDLVKNGVTMRTLSQANRIYSFDENIFENIDSHEKAYWIGFIGADGSIYNNLLKIALAIKDKDHLEKFKVFMKSKHPIHFYNVKCKNKLFESCEFSISSDKIIADLAKLNIVNKKSLTLKPPIIDKQYYCSYIRGLIDGDGCFNIDKLGQKKLSLVGSINICKFVMDTLVENCEISETKIANHAVSKDTFICYFGGNNKIKKIVDFIYSDKSIFLERKYKIATSPIINNIKYISSKNKCLHIMPHFKGWIIRKGELETGSFILKTKEDILSKAKNMALKNKYLIVVYNSNFEIISIDDSYC